MSGYRGTNGHRRKPCVRRARVGDRFMWVWTCPCCWMLTGDINWDQLAAFRAAEHHTTTAAHIVRAGSVRFGQLSA